MKESRNKNRRTDVFGANTININSIVSSKNKLHPTKLTQTKPSLSKHANKFSHTKFNSKLTNVTQKTLLSKSKNKFSVGKTFYNSSNKQFIPKLKVNSMLKTGTDFKKAKKAVNEGNNSTKNKDGLKLGFTKLIMNKKLGSKISTNLATLKKKLKVKANERLVLHK